MSYRTYMAAIIVGLGLPSAPLSALDWAQHDFTNTQQQTARYAGIYLSLPFGSTKPVAKEDLRFGFRAGFRHDVRWNQYGTTVGRGFNADLMTLDFTGRGFSKLEFAGAKLIHTDAAGRIAYLDDDDDDSDGLPTLVKAFLWGGGAMAAILLVATAESCTDNTPDEDSGVQCPL